MLIKSRRALAASVLALAAAGGVSAVVIQATSSSPPVTALAPAAQPSAAGPAAVAAVPRGAGGADGAGTAARTGSAAAGSGTAAAGSPAAAGQTAAAETAPAGPSSPAAGQPDVGPRAPGSIAADGAAPGASAAARQLDAARAAQTGRTHSPQLLAQLNGPPAAAAGQTAAAGAAAPRTLPGLDVAAFQHPASKTSPKGQVIGWGAVFAGGYKFVAVKATEGTYYVNPWAAADLAGAWNAGLDVAPYHFAIPNEGSGAAQAAFAVKYSGYKTGTRMLPLMLDIEYDPYVNTDHTNSCYGLTKAKMVSWISGFVSQAKAETGQYPVIYTTADWWSTCTGGSTVFSPDPMWVAAYGTSSPPLPAGRHSWTFWQYASNGTVHGVATAGATDVDSFSPAAVGLIQPAAQSTPTGWTVKLQLSSLGALAGESLSYQVSGLPAGLTLSKAGAISGTVRRSAAATSGQTYTVTVLARNSAGGSAKIKFSWRVTPA